MRRRLVPKTERVAEEFHAKLSLVGRCACAVPREGYLNPVSDGHLGRRPEWRPSRDELPVTTRARSTPRERVLCIGDRPWVGRSVMGSRDPKGRGGMPIKRRRAAARRPAGDGISVSFSSDTTACRPGTTTGTSQGTSCGCPRTWRGQRSCRCPP